ncbi:MAG TPA: HD domain-containing protein [Gemmatimonadaceae bacterium]|jgi:3'-5' exoribonuclease|nr:HD domain-containing protein [Gemmatimonadaceae bacterium]
MPPLVIPNLAPGERVASDLLVFDRAEKKTNAGDPFVVLTLGNSSGKIETAPIWSDKLQWAEGARSGKVVQAIGDVTVYSKGGTGRKQLSLSGPVRILPDAVFRAEEFLPSIGGDLLKLWSWIDRVRAEVESSTLRGVLDLFFADDDFRVRFERSPASTGGHHAKLGGLLLHVYEVTNIAKQTARTVHANVDLAVTGALLHDIGKIEAYEVGPTGFTHTPCGLLLGHIVLGSLMLERRHAGAGGMLCSDGQLTELHHMILSHHGSLEYGSPVQPMTTEAEIVHWADEASAKATDMIELLSDSELFAGGQEYSDRQHWRLGRRIWRRPHSWE